ncbi:MAG: flagellar transcriptional regulator FlhD [Acidiferrobacterales bacterium]
MTMELPNALISDIRSVNFRYLLLARDLAIINPDYAVDAAGVPARIARALATLSMDEIDRICDAAGPVPLCRARFGEKVWCEIVHAGPQNDSAPFVALAACSEDFA